MESEEEQHKLDEIVDEKFDMFECRPCDPVAEDVRDEVEGEGEEAHRERPLRDPGQPTQEMIDEHEVTHMDFRSWCAACVRGRAQANPSRTVKGLFAEHVLPRVRMDYAHLTEEVETKEGEHGEERTVSSNASLTCAVMQESLTKSVWAYAVASKGAKENWMVDQVLEDLETAGLRNDRIVLKTDQEPAITEVMKEVQRRRECDYGTAIDNSRVGDSDSNGTIENTIKQFEGMARTTRFALEEKLGQKIAMDSTAMLWLVRHAAHIITRCRVRNNGRTAYQQKEQCKAGGFWRMRSFQGPKRSD